MKCPECGKIHKNQKTANTCYQNVIFKKSWIYISDNKSNKDEQCKFDSIQLYYDNLPLNLTKAEINYFNKIS